MDNNVPETKISKAKPTAKPAPKKPAKKAEEKPWVCPILPEIQWSHSTLKSQIKAGNIPKEWNELYDGISKMIKTEFTKNPNKMYFYKELNVQYGYGLNYYKSGKQAPYSHAILLNDYLTKRLKSEGFHHASIRLIYIPAKGNRWAKEINATRQSQYNIEYADWQRRKIAYDVYTPDAIADGPSSPGKAPTPPDMESTAYVESKYVIMVQCSRIKDKAAKKTEKNIRILQRQKTGCKLNGNLMVLLAYVLPLLAMAAVAAAVCGIGMLVKPDFSTQTFLSFAGVPFIAVGLLLGWGCHSALYKNGFLS